MSQTITYDVAKTLKKGDTLYHNIIEFTLEDGTTVPATATVLGRVKKVSGPDEFHLPIHQNYGADADVFMSRFGSTLWRTTPEKEVQVDPARVRRQRSVVTVTGRIVDETGHLLQVAQDQLLAVAKRVKRTRG